MKPGQKLCHPGEVSLLLVAGNEYENNSWITELVDKSPLFFQAFICGSSEWYNLETLRKEKSHLTGR